MPAAEAAVLARLLPISSVLSSRSGLPVSRSITAPARGCRSLSRRSRTLPSETREVSAALKKAESARQTTNPAT